jgi:hypothetical protein
MIRFNSVESSATPHAVSQFSSEFAAPLSDFCLFLLQLIYLIMGPDSGVFVSAVAANVIKFAAAIPAQSLLGIAIVLALIFMLSKRVR